MTLIIKSHKYTCSISATKLAFFGDKTNWNHSECTRLHCFTHQFLKIFDAGGGPLSRCLCMASACTFKFSPVINSSEKPETISFLASLIGRLNLLKITSLKRILHRKNNDSEVATLNVSQHGKEKGCVLANKMDRWRRTERILLQLTR